MIKARGLLQDAQKAIADPINHGQIFPVAWQHEHRAEAQRILDDAWKDDNQSIASVNERTRRKSRHFGNGTCNLPSPQRHSGIYSDQTG